MSDRLMLLIDGMALAYRAFHAIQGLTTKDGFPTNALFGFIKMVRQLEQTWQPTHWAVVFDGGLPAERMKLLETYKAQRAEMPDDLRRQLDPINEYLALSGIPALRLEGEEADDAMATVATRAAQQKAAVLLATSDKDLFQLVNESVHIVSPVKAGVRMGPAEIKEKTGVNPGQIVGWLALTGDQADNIPGVPGIGPKTAAKLLGQFGTLDAMWCRLGEVTPERIRHLLEQHRSVVDRNVNLLRLRTNLPCELDWAAVRVRSAEPDRLLPFLDRMEFHTMAGMLRDEAQRLL